MTVLLTDGDQRSTLAAVRALGASGLKVLVAEDGRTSLASSSRYCAGHVAYPSPYDDEAAFVRAITSAASRHRVDLIIPMTDITSAILSENGTALPPTTRVAVMDPDAFWRASDKIALHRLATDIGVPSPTEQIVDPSGDPDWKERLTFPCVIKPARSRLRTSHGWLKTVVRRVDSRESLDRLLSAESELSHPFMVQRVIDGEGVGVFALVDRGEARIMFAHRRLREKPPWGGVSVLRESVAVDPVAGEYAARLLRALCWHGVAMVEFKKERSTGIPYLMEINGRFWGSLQLAIDAGLNFPLELAHLWAGEPVAEVSGYRVGIRSRWLLGDLDHVLMRLRANTPVPAGSPTIPALLLDFCRFLRRDTRLEVESLRDPSPAVHELRCYTRDLFRSIRGSHA
jgi:predicted ATP-grasp superfamily ATP-dependent carboligase